MRVCIVAEHASTHFGGEAFLPLRYFSLLRARGIDAWLIVHSRTRTELAALFPNETNRILYVPDLWIHRFLFRLSCYLPRRVSEATFGLINQLVTQFCQRSMLRKLVKKEEVDVVHQPIPISPRFPSALFGIGIPVVIGPLNGGMEYPPAFRGNETWASRAAIAFLKLFAELGNSLVPGKIRAAVVLVANERTRNALPRRTRGKVTTMSENGIDIETWRSDLNDEVPANAVFVFVGRLVDWKALDIVIKALAKVPVAQLEVVGDGPMFATWSALAKKMGVSQRVHFVGRESQVQYATRLRHSVGLVLPSLYESGGAVVLEAMAAAKPVIATRWGGPKDYLDSSSGILVAPQNYESLVTGFAEAMQKLIDQPEMAKAMGEAGRRRAVRDYDWQQRIDRMISIYGAVTGESASLHTLNCHCQVCLPAAAIK
jgi:glycosyltransferase involved in cell wall biosynthesis